MIRLHSIEAVNFRSLGDVTFTPLVDDRLTAIVGSNGTGKSSLVDGLLWALYGVAPEGMNIRDLRRQGTASGDECRVTVTFEHDGQTIVVTRQLKGNKDTTVAGITVDGVETTATNVRAANEWIANRIGLDADGFLAAVLVQQKQVDALVTAPPRERRDLVERLARIDKMGQAAQAARKSALEAQRVLDALPGRDEDVAETAERLEDASRIVREAEQALADAETQERDAQTAFETTRETATEVAVALEKRKQAEAVHAEAASELRVLQAQLPAAESEVVRLERLARAGDPAKVEAAQAAVTAANTEVERLSGVITKAREQEWEAGAVATKAASAKTEAETAAAAKRKAQTKADTLAESLREAQERVSSFPLDVRDQLVAARDAAEELSQQVGAARGEYDRLGSAIAALNGTHDPSCPTCAQPIHDLTALVTGLESDREAVKARGTRLRAALDEANATTTRLQADVSAWESATADVTRLAGELSAAQVALADAERVADETAQAAREAEAKRMAAVAMLDALQKQAVDAEAGLSAAQEKAESAAEALREAKAAKAAADELVAARAALTSLEDRISNAESEVLVTRVGVDEIVVPSEDEQARIRQEWTDRQTAVAQATALVGERRGEVKAATTALTHAESAAQTAVQQRQARSAAAADVERKVATRDALEAFRKDRLNRLAPELAEVASDLVNRMTNGKYVAVHLDEDFTPTVTDEHGHRRPVSWLSGGEESLVALALRIAIGDVVFGANGGLLFLDEVLSAMDEFRRDATISAVRELPGRQIVMINHIPEAADIGDLVLRVTPGPDGSVLEPVDKDGENVHLEALEFAEGEQ